MWHLEQRRGGESWLKESLLSCGWTSLLESVNLQFYLRIGYLTMRLGNVSAIDADRAVDTAREASIA
jgi:hypothetical protein